MILIPYRSVLDLARDLEHGDGHGTHRSRGYRASATSLGRVLAALRSVARRWPSEATAPGAAAVATWRGLIDPIAPSDPPA